MDAELQAKWGAARLARSPRRHPILFSTLVFLIAFASIHKWLGSPLYIKHLSAPSQLEVFARDADAATPDNDDWTQKVLAARWPVGALFAPRWEALRRKLGVHRREVEEREPGMPETSQNETKLRYTTGPYFDSYPRIARLSQGNYLGTWQGVDGYGCCRSNLDLFYGIPYAQSTAGDHRFRLPQPMPPSNKTYSAENLGPLCPVPGRESSDEDCLRVNVVRPAITEVEWRNSSKKLLPVGIFVHGQQWKPGSQPDEMLMRRTVSWSEAGPMIAVSFNYRVGVLGLLPAGAIDCDGSPLDEMSLGLRDQQMLFEWVRENIEAFGGDKNKITLVGVGAGSRLVCEATSNREPVFRVAFLDSQKYEEDLLADIARNATRTQALVKELVDNLDIGDLPRDRWHSALRDMPLEKLMEAASKVEAMKPTYTGQRILRDLWPYGPNGMGRLIDQAGDCDHNNRPIEHDKYRQNHDPKYRNRHGGHYGSRGTYISIPRTHPHPRNWRPPSDPLEHGTFPRIPIFTGFATNEGARDIPPDTASDTDADFRAFFRDLIPGLSDAELDELSMLYPDPSSSKIPDQKKTQRDKLKRDSSQYASVPPGKGPQWARLEAAYSDYAYICPVIQTAAFFSSPSAPPTSDPVCPSKCCRSPKIGFPPPTPDTTFPPPPRGGPVYLYQYAAVSGPLKTANGGDSIAPVLHDMRVIDPDGETHPYPGLMAISDAMHGALNRFITTGEVEDGGLPWKPVSGLSPWVAGDHQKREIAGGETPGAHAGIMVFGEGNDELAGGNHTGIAAKMGEIGEERMRRCQFWWAMAESKARQSQKCQRMGGGKKAKCCKCKA